MFCSACACPWARPSIYPDIEGILNDPVAAYQFNRLGAGLVSLPGATGSVDAIGGLIQKGKQDPFGNLGQMLGTQPAVEAAPAASADQQPVGGESAASPKKSKKRQAETRSAAEAAAKQALQSLFGN